MTQLTETTRAPLAPCQEKYAHYDILAPLFAHPTEHFTDDVERAAGYLARHYPKAHAALQTFIESCPLHDLDAMQELYARTFDIQAVTTLDIGYILFGEDYKRGALLANLNGEHRKAGIDCATELADHLPNIMRLLPRLDDDELRHELVTVLLGPALRGMISEFATDRLAKQDELYQKHYKTLIEFNQTVPRAAYGDVLKALYEVMRVDFGLRVALQIEQDSEFLRSLGTEMNIEACDTCATGPTSA